MPYGRFSGKVNMSEGGGIQSLDNALTVLKALASFGGPVALSELARETGMPASKVHRYLASFANAGLVQQAGRSGKYDLGPGAVQLGLAAMARLDFVNRTADALHELCAETGLTTLMSVWGNAGPTVVRWERAPGFIVTTLGLGTAMPLLNSASGRMFLAHAPRQVIGALLAEELAAAPGTDADAIARDVREAGYARVASDLIPGLAAISAPVLDWQGEIEVAVTLISTDPAITAPDAAPVAALKRFCQALSLPAPE